MQAGREIEMGPAPATTAVDCTFEYLLFYISYLNTLCQLLLQCYFSVIGTIDQFHKSHNAPVPHTRMFHSEQKCAHFCSEWCILGYGTGALGLLYCPSEVEMSELRLKFL